MSKDKLKEINNVAAALEIIGLRGKTILTPEVVNVNSLHKVQDVRGKLIICDLHVDQVLDTRGKLVLVDSTANLVAEHRGKVVLYNSVVDECRDIKGVLSVVGEKSVCHKVEGSNVEIKIRRDEN